MSKVIKEYFNLVFGFAGPYGAGCSSLVEELNTIYDKPPYKVFNIDVSDLILKKYNHMMGQKALKGNENSFTRRKLMQNIGTKLRVIDKDIVGKLIIASIWDKAYEFEEDKHNDPSSICKCNVSGF